MTEAYHNPDADEPFKQRLGRCYELAGRFASENSGTTLVHGTIQGFGNPRIDHAWVELPGGDTWEPASNRTWPAEVYNNLFNPIATHKFTHDETMKQTLRRRHWGPWTPRPVSKQIKRLTGSA